jgi:hypothetical protein
VKSNILGLFKCKRVINIFSKSLSVLSGDSIEILVLTLSTEDENDAGLQ